MGGQERGAALLSVAQAAPPPSFPERHTHTRAHTHHHYTHTRARTQGEIVERGTHKELLELDGMYAALVAKQSLAVVKVGRRACQARGRRAEEGRAASPACRP